MEIFDGMGQAADVIGGKWVFRLTLKRGKGKETEKERERIILLK